MSNSVEPPLSRKEFLAKRKVFLANRWPWQREAAAAAAAAAGVPTVPVKPYECKDLFKLHPWTEEELAFIAEPRVKYSKKLGAATSLKDKAKVLKATDIVASISRPSGYGGCPTLKDIADKLKETPVVFDVSGVRESTLKSRERFRKQFASCNEGNDVVNTASLTQYLKCSMIKALATLQRVDGSDSKLIGNKAISFFNFRENFLKPLIPLFFSQHKASDLKTFPYRYTKLINEAKKDAAEHLPTFHAKTIICRSLCQLLIDCCPLGSYYLLGFCFLLCVLVMSGRRWGPISRVKISDIEEITVLKNSDGLKPKVLHLSIVMKLARDKDRCDNIDQSVALYFLVIFQPH